METNSEDSWLASSSSSSSSDSDNTYQLLTENELDNSSCFSFTTSNKISPLLIKDLCDDDSDNEDSLSLSRVYPFLEELTLPDPLMFCHASNITCVHEEDVFYAGSIRMGLMIKHFDIILVSPTKSACKMAGMLGFIQIPKICIAEIRPRKDFMILKIPILLNNQTTQLYPNIDFNYLKKTNFLFVDTEENEFEYLRRLKQFFYTEIPSEFRKLIHHNRRPSFLLVVDRETSRDIHYVGTRLDRL
jgi:hypothetical protein